MRLSIISLAILITTASNYSVVASLGNSAHHIEGSATGAVNHLAGSHGNAVPAVVNKLERRSFTSRSRAITRAKVQRRNSSLLPDIVLPSITSAQASAPAAARPIPQAVSYPAAAAAVPVAQSYYTPQPAAQGYANSQQAAAIPNYVPQQPQQAAAPASPYYYTPQAQQPAATVPATPKLTLPTLFQPPKEKEDDDNDSDDEDEEDEDEEDEEDYDADDLVTRRRRLDTKCLDRNITLELLSLTGYNPLSEELLKKQLSSKAT
ncbi:hypothetical protein MBANPS3_006479 [Mucor bainieri]